MHLWFCQFLGTTAARIRFNATTRVEQDGAQYWAKERFAWSPALVTAANAYAKAVGLPMRMLHEAEWLNYENLVYRQLLNQPAVLRQGKRLLLPEVSGDKLQMVLGASDLNTKQLAIRLAVEALARLHQQTVINPLSGASQTFSHADATLGNVVVDLKNQTATWLDFETVHPMDMTQETRHADDIRTLLCGLAAVVSLEEIPVLIQTAVEAYKDKDVLAALCEMFRQWNERPAMRILAMPAPRNFKWSCLMKSVLTS